MTVKPRQNHLSRQPPLYDDECQTIKKQKFKFLDMFAKTGTQFFYYQFRNLRNKFKHLVQAKARSYMESMRKKVEDSIGDQKKFWNQVKKLTLTGLSGSAVSGKTWFDYYKELLNRKPQSVDKEFDKHLTELIETHNASCILCQNNLRVTQS